MATTATGYSITMGGKAGYINIAGWNSTITDVSTSPKEVCGVERKEGANTYIYAMAGSGAVAARQICKLCTMIADADSNVAPLRMTQMAITEGTTPVQAFAMGVSAVGTSQYGWFFRKGITTAMFNTNSAAVVGAVLAPSTATVNLWCSGLTSTGYGFVLEAAATATAVASGVLAYINFENCLVA